MLGLSGLVVLAALGAVRGEVSLGIVTAVPGAEVELPVRYDSGGEEVGLGITATVPEGLEPVLVARGDLQYLDCTVADGVEDQVFATVARGQWRMMIVRFDSTDIPVPFGEIARCRFRVAPNATGTLRLPCVASGARACPLDCNSYETADIESEPSCLPGAVLVACSGDLNLDGQVSINELVSAVNAAVTGCP